MHLVKLLVAAGAIVGGGFILGGTAHADDITDGTRTVTIEVSLAVEAPSQEMAAINSMEDGLRVVNDLTVVVADFPTTTVPAANVMSDGDGLRSVSLEP